MHPDSLARPQKWNLPPLNIQSGLIRTGLTPRTVLGAPRVHHWKIESNLFKTNAKSGQKKLTESVAHEENMLGALGLKRILIYLSKLLNVAVNRRSLS
jgi:hypothetical protein